MMWWWQILDGEMSALRDENDSLRAQLEMMSDPVCAWGRGKGREAREKRLLGIVGLPYMSHMCWYRGPALHEPHVLVSWACPT